MIKNIIKDQKFLMIKSIDAKESDLYVLTDLIDTLSFNREKCVGMAANMIGYSVRILVFINELEKIDYMINPIIIKKEDEYEASEGCLSLDGVRKTKRYDKVKVSYYNDKFQKRIKVFKGFVAEIIQHEIDHFDGIII